MFDSGKKIRYHPGNPAKNYMTPGEKLLNKKGKSLFSRLSKLFKSIRIDQKALRGSLEIIFWK